MYYLLSCHTYTYQLTAKLQSIACFGISGYKEQHECHPLACWCGLNTSTEIRCASLHGLSPHTNFDDWIIVAESFTMITWVPYTHKIHFALLITPV